MKYKKIISMNNCYNKHEDFSLLEFLMKGIAKFYMLNQVTFECSLYAHFIDYLRYICLKLYYTNSDCNTKEHAIFLSYAALVENLNMVQNIDYQNKIINLKNEYQLTRKNIKKFFNGEYKGNRSINRIYNSYNFIVKRQNDTSLFKTATAKYIYYLIRYTRELEFVLIEKKISPIFNETFYTDLGEIAFNLFNKANFIEILPRLKVNNILDIGCGNGNFIDAFLEHNKSSNVYGVERQSKVCKKLYEKYKQVRNVKIINDDVKNVKFNIKFDLINISYMLFYLSTEEQKKMLRTLRTLLTPDGKIIVCQYFPDIEDIQMRIAIDDNNWGKIDRYKFQISNAILYAEVLLNDSLSDFNHASRFDEFKEIIGHAKLFIEDVEKADNNYYSFYFMLSQI